MIKGIFTSASGMQPHSVKMEVIANNLANIDTTGFKKSRIEFEDLLYQTLEEPGSESKAGVLKPVGLQVGLGVTPVASLRVFAQGELSGTGNPMDIAIEGDGFFQIRDPNNGEILYTRNGSFKITGDGEIATSKGYLLEPPVQVPEGASDVNIGPSGEITALMSGDESGVPETIGQIELSRFLNPSGMKALGGNLFAPTESSGISVQGTPGEGFNGVLRSQFLEASNVQMVEEMVNMIVAQRAYEVSSKAITTSDEMLQTANQIKR